MGRRSCRQIDAASLALLVIGLMFAGLSYWLITNHGLNVLVIVPSIVATTTGATHVIRAPKR